MKHLNGHLLCAIDTETTGLIPGYNDVIQVSIMPLDYKLDPSKDYFPFDMKIVPRRKENIDPKALEVNRSHLADIMVNGVEADLAADLFEEWFIKLNLPPKKRIMPLAHNWAFDSAFLRDWLGFYNMNDRIDGRYRDTQAVALYLNDVADVYQEDYPYPKVSLRYCASQLKILVDESRVHDSLYDCLVCTQIYKFMLRQKIGM